MADIRKFLSATNFETKAHKELEKSAKAFKSKMNGTPHRKGLQTMPSNVLAGKPGDGNKKTKKRKLSASHEDKNKIRKLHPLKGEVNVYEDENSPVEDVTGLPLVGSNGDNTVKEQQNNIACTCGRKQAHIGDGSNETGTDAWQLMVNEAVPEVYWEDLAEERRIALEAALEENKELHGQVNELIEERVHLTDMAGQAEYFASMLKTLTDGEGTKEHPSECHRDTPLPETVCTSQDTEDTDTSVLAGSDNDSFSPHCKRELPSTENASSDTS